MTQSRFNQAFKKATVKNASRERKELLKKVKAKYKKPKKAISTSKLILLVLILFYLQIVLFIEYMILKSGNVNALYTLISVPATLIPIVWKYYSKSQAENTQGGIVYETAMLDCETIKSKDNE